MTRVLLVDDEPNVVQALRRLLRRHLSADVVVESFTDPLAALSRVSEAAFDVVVSDYRMPQMDGLSFLEQVRGRQPHAARLVLSATTDVATIMAAVNHVEVFRYLTKPWVDEEVVLQIRLAIDRTQHADEERDLANGMRQQMGSLSAAERERQRLEREEPGITSVQWGPNGEVLMPDLLDPD